MAHRLTIWALALLATGCLAVGPPKPVGQHQYRQVARVGQSKKLLCPVESDPSPIIQWFKDGVAVIDMWVRFRLKEGSLRIKDIELEDAGKYVCKATNGFGTINVNYSLIVVDKESGIVKQDNSIFPQSPDEDLTKEGVPPRFLQEQKMKRKKIERPVDSSVRLKCRANGNPRPRVHWIKDGHETADSVKDINGERKPQWTLKLHDLKESDSGDYVCLVSNRLGSINFTYTLEVIGKMKTKPVLIGPHPRNETVNVGGTVSFQCKVKSVVQPHIQWLKRVDKDSGYEHNQSATIDVKGQKFVVLKTGSVWKDSSGFYINKLMLRNVQYHNAGMYICLGANSIGYSFRSAYLTVVSYAHTSGVDGRRRGSSSSSSSSILGNRNIQVGSGGDDSNYPPQSSSSAESEGSGSNGSLPLIIAIPACVVIVAVTVAIFILKRRRRCIARSPAHRNTRFNAVPQHDNKETYPPSVHTNPHMVAAPASSSRSGDKMSKNQYVDFLSDISSVSRSHHNNQQPPPQHNNIPGQQYGY